MLHIFISNRIRNAVPGSLGTLVPGYVAKIVDDLGGVVPEGCVGDLWVRGASGCVEYWHRGEETRKTSVEGWVKTGDKCARDKDG